MNIIRCPEQALSADFGDIIIENVAEKMNFKVTFNQEVILQETYFPDNNGVIYIRDLALLAEMYRPKASLTPEANSAIGSISFNLEFTENAQTLTKKITIYTCDVETARTLTVTDLQTMPLTRCFKKPVCPGQKEYISFYGSGNITVDLVYTGITQDRFATFVLENLPENPETIYRQNVSPETVASLAGIDQSQIVYYTVYKSKKNAAKFTMNKYRRPEKTFVFQNAFGAPETFTCTGDEEKENKWTREYGRIARRQQLVGRQLEATNTIQTGYLTREETGALEDLLNAKQVTLIDEYGWHPVIITEETFKVISRKDELINIEFKYRLAGDNHLQYRFKPYRHRIFDFTFDNSFN